MSEDSGCMFSYQLNNVLRVQQFSHLTMCDSDIDEFYERAAFGGPWTIPPYFNKPEYSAEQIEIRQAVRDRLRRHEDATEINLPGKSMVWLSGEKVKFVFS